MALAWAGLVRNPCSEVLVTPSLAYQLPVSLPHTPGLFLSIIFYVTCPTPTQPSDSGFLQPSADWLKL